MGHSIWQHCLGRLADEISDEQFDTYIKPLQVRIDDGAVSVFAPNIYVEEQVRMSYLARIRDLVSQVSGLDEEVDISLVVGDESAIKPLRADAYVGKVRPAHNLNADFSFDGFVEGKSNELAKAAALQVADNAGNSYNPLLLYGGVGLGKTHLMQAVGNGILANNPDANVMYLHSQKFVQDMVKALQQGTMPDFVQYYRSVDALLIDDIQFFAEEVRSQEEFFPRLQRAARDGSRWCSPAIATRGDRRPRGTLEVALRLGSHGASRAARAGNARGHL